MLRAIKKAIAPANQKAITYAGGIHPEVVLTSGKTLAAYLHDYGSFFGVRFVEVIFP